MSFLASFLLILIWVGYVNLAKNVRKEETTFHILVETGVVRMRNLAHGFVISPHFYSICIMRYYFIVSAWILTC
ncbi:hypothetical protein LV28_25340 [Pandoraea pnomenusa]|nr:hypothetical protein LV28_25340 [Pandoraea pnomenusa]